MGRNDTVKRVIMMNSLQPKKLLIMNILDILRKYSDAEHTLSQRDIGEILRDEYDMTADRKSIKRNLMDLIEFGYNINYTETLRMVPGKDGKPEESYILSGFYLEREFTDSELRLLIDSLLFSKHIPYSQCKELVGKLEKLSNKYFESRVKYIKILPDNLPDNPQLFYTIEILDEAIAGGRQVQFHYCSYGTDKKQHANLDADGKPKEYLVNPYQMVAANGRYYLIGNCQKYDNVIHFRVDRIQNITVLESKAKPMNQVKELKNGLNLPKHMAEHLYMFSGESVPVTFRMKKYILNDVIDWFGTDIVFTDETEDEVTARVTVNWSAMRHWALQYARHVVIMEPENLANQVREDFTMAVEKYNS